MSRNVIADGYTREAFIAAEPNLHDSLRFRFRPLLPEQADIFTREDFKSRPPRQSVLMVASAIKSQLVEWSEVDGQGKPLPLSAENIARLPWRLFNRLFNVVAGFIPSDPLPDAPADEQCDYARELLAAAGEGVSIGVHSAVASAKN